MGSATTPTKDHTTIDVAGAGAGPDEAAGPEHLPLRPLWRCTVCTWPWPCPPARRRLTDTSPVLYLAIYLAGCYADALTDRPDLHPAVLYTRILGWVGPRTRTDDPPAAQSISRYRTDRLATVPNLAGPRPRPGSVKKTW